MKFSTYLNRRVFVMGKDDGHEEQTLTNKTTHFELSTNEKRRTATDEPLGTLSINKLLSGARDGVEGGGGDILIS